MTVTVKTVYASIGNSDDKLSQKRWSQFVREFVAQIQRHAQLVFGVWHSLPNSPYQNACVCFQVDSDGAQGLQLILGELRARFDQDSVAWAEVTETEFV